MRHFYLCCHSFFDLFFDWFVCFVSLFAFFFAFFFILIIPPALSNFHAPLSVVPFASSTWVKSTPLHICSQRLRAKLESFILQCFIKRGFFRTVSYCNSKISYRKTNEENKNSRPNSSVKSTLNLFLSVSAKNPVPWRRQNSFNCKKLLVV
jgi:hypothetical protein